MSIKAICAKCGKAWLEAGFVVDEKGGRKPYCPEHAPAESLGVFPDVNGNGIPDYKEPWFWRFALRTAARVIVFFAAPHTVAFKAADRVLAEVP